MVETLGRARAQWNGRGKHQQQSRSESESEIKGRGRRTHGGEQTITPFPAQTLHLSKQYKVKPVVKSQDIVCFHWTTVMDIAGNKLKLCQGREEKPRSEHGGNRKGGGGEIESMRG